MRFTNTFRTGRAGQPRGKLPAHVLPVVAVVAAGLVAGTSWVGAIPAASAAESGRTPASAPPPPEEIHQLDFLLGRFRCDVTIAPPGGEKIRSSIVAVGEKTLSGHWYQFTSMQEAGPKSDYANGAWLFGWNDTTNQFTNFWRDNYSNYGTQTSPGAADGHLIFTGKIVDRTAGPLPYRDDFTVQDKDHFKYEWSVQVQGTWYPAGVSACTRTRAKNPPLRNPAEPEEIHQLDGMLGNWRCTTTSSLPDGTTSLVRSAGRIHPILGGNWLQWDAVQLPGGDGEGIVTTALIGWSAPEQQYVLFYSDDRGNVGVSYAPPKTADGRVTFAGDLVVTPQGRLTYQDSFVVDDARHFHDDFAIQLDGTWVPLGVHACIRT